MTPALFAICYGVVMFSIVVQDLIVERIARRFPDADQRISPLAKPEISRFPRKERPHMPGSPTAPGRLGARNRAPGPEFRAKNS